MQRAFPPYVTIYIVKPLQKVILVLYGILFFLVPVILWPFTSELFEFNKMVTVYLLTILIVATWSIRMIKERKFIFRRTILDIPLIIFLGSQIISTFLSIDPLTSWLGYYSRFNGGLLSVVSYLLLYWAFISNLSRDDAKKLIRYSLLPSALLVSLIGILEHFNINPTCALMRQGWKSCWVQDVQHRVFSTLGQPNWLAAWLVALSPITWALILKNIGKKISFNNILPHFLSILFFVVLLFTGSRSGLFGFGVAVILFWGVVLLKYRFDYIKKFLIINILIGMMAVLFGTQVTPSIFKLLQNNQVSQVTAVTQSGSTALETGGTESVVIRKIVWQGAIQVWAHYPVFGTGLETFAYSYYLYRPAAHNMTSEWDFIYNKAHNEYLNFMANSGTVGILAYLTMVGFAIYTISINVIHKNEEMDDFSQILPIALVAGYSSILVTNFFGFSVVPIEILFYLYPAFAVVLASPDIIEKDNRIISSPNSKFFSWVIVAIGGVLIFITCRYWYADYLYATGVNYDRANHPDISPKYYSGAIKLEPNQATYYAYLAKAYTNLAVAYAQSKEATAASQLTEAAINNSIKSVDLSPANVNLKRMEYGVFAMLSTLDPNYLLDTRDVLQTAIKQAPTDAKIYYYLAIAYSKIGQNDLALQTLQRTIDLKPNYGDARLAYGILLIDAKRFTEAKSQLEYILTNIDPTNSIAKQYLESIK